MKIHGSFWMMVVLVGIVLLGISTNVALAANQGQFQVDRQMMRRQEAAQTPVPTQSEIPEETETPEERILPPVGGNAVLVLGASALVLIVIGGVMIISRRRSKH